MRYTFIMLFAFAVVCSLLSFGSFIFWAVLVSQGAPALGILVSAAGWALLSLVSFFTWAFFLRRHETT